MYGDRNAIQPVSRDTPGTEYATEDEVVVASRLATGCAVRVRSWCVVSCVVVVTARQQQALALGHVRCQRHVAMAGR